MVCKVIGQILNGRELYSVPCAVVPPPRARPPLYSAAARLYRHPRGTACWQPDSFLASLAGGGIVSPGCCCRASGAVRYIPLVTPSLESAPGRDPVEPEDWELCWALGAAGAKARSVTGTTSSISVCLG